MAILYTLLCYLNLYLFNFNNYFHNHAENKYIPYQQIKNSNNVLVLFLGLLTLLVISISSGLPLTNPLIQVGKAFLRLLFKLLIRDDPPDMVPSSEPETGQFPPIESSEILGVIFKIVEWLFLILLAVAMITFISYSIYKICRQIYQHYYKKSDNKVLDQVEVLSPFSKNKASKNVPYELSKKQFGHSNNAKIRRLFYKAISTSVKDEAKLQRDLTPSDLAEMVKLSSKSIDPETSSDYRNLITKYYEKARYSNVDCSKDEVKRMKQLLK
jgi:hypothetical protein